MRRLTVLSCIGVMLFLSVPALAGNGVVFLTLDINDRMEVTDYDLFFLNDQEGYRFIKDSGTMRVEMLNENQDVLYYTGFTPSFIVLSDPPVRTEETSVILTLPYNRNMKTVRIYNSSAEVLSIMFQEKLCNQDGVCNGFENIYSCPGDCTSQSNDGVCAGQSFDGVCDPDCPSWRDLDCSCPNGICEHWENSNYCPADCSGGPVWTYIGVAIISLSAGLAAFFASRKLRTRRSDEIHWTETGTNNTD